MAQSAYYALQTDLDMVITDVQYLKDSYKHLDYIVKIVTNLDIEHRAQAAQRARMDDELELMRKRMDSMDMRMREMRHDIDLMGQEIILMKHDIAEMKQDIAEMKQNIGLIMKQLGIITKHLGIQPV